jgi:hypothetical protein
MNECRQIKSLNAISACGSDMGGVMGLLAGEGMMNLPQLKMAKRVMERRYL